MIYIGNFKFVENEEKEKTGQIYFMRFNFLGKYSDAES
jgi:hypothetical protein